MTDAEWKQTLDDAVNRTNNRIDYAEACGRVAAQMRLPASFCPYEQHDWARDSWVRGYMCERRSMRFEVTSWKTN